MKNKLFLIALPLVTMCLSSCGQKNKYTPDQYMLDLPGFVGDQYKILQLSDIHLGNKDDLEKHFKFLDLTINEAKPDLIVLCGDIFTFADNRTATSLFKFFEEHKIPWTATFGNHDEQTYFTITELTRSLNAIGENGGYCYFKDIHDDDIYGFSNFCINLTDGKNTKFQVYLIDSNRYHYGSYMGYDVIHPDQIQWYEEMVKFSKNKYGDVKSFAFYHIPVPEYQTAYDLAKAGSPEAHFINGHSDLREQVSCPKENSGFFSKEVELGSTIANFVAHDHVNDCAVEYKGISLYYGVTSTDRIYADGDKMGGLLITINSDSTFTTKNIYHTYEEIK